LKAPWSLAVLVTIYQSTQHNVLEDLTLQYTQTTLWKHQIRYQCLLFLEDNELGMMYENTQTGNQLPVSVIFALPSGSWGNISATLGKKLKVIIHLHFGTFGLTMCQEYTEIWHFRKYTKQKKNLNKLTGTKENTLKFGKDTHNGYKIRPLFLLKEHQVLHNVNHSKHQNLPDKLHVTWLLSHLKNMQCTAYYYNNVQVMWV